MAKTISKGSIAERILKYLEDGQIRRYQDLFFNQVVFKEANLKRLQNKIHNLEIAVANVTDPDLLEDSKKVLNDFKEFYERKLLQNQDFDINELYQVNDLNCSSWAAKYIGTISHQTLLMNLRMLENKKMIQKLVNGNYKITWYGSQLIKGEGK